MSKPQLSSAPSLHLKNGEENPVVVYYYQDCIAISQQGAYNEPEEILLDRDEFERIFKAIRANMEQAQLILDKR